MYREYQYLDVSCGTCPVVTLHSNEVKRERHVGAEGEGGGGTNRKGSTAGRIRREAESFKFDPYYYVSLPVGETVNGTKLLAEVFEKSRASLQNTNEVDGHILVIVPNHLCHALHAVCSDG